MASSPFLVTKVKTSFQPGSDITSIADTIGSILIQDPNFVNALAAAFTGSELVANTGTFASANISILHSNTGFINHLTVSEFEIEHFIPDTIVSGTGTFNYLISNSISGAYSTFNEITGTYVMISTGTFEYLNAGTGHFTVLSADNFEFPSNETLRNLNVTDTLTGVSVYAKSMTGGTIYCNSLQSPSAYVTEFSSSTGKFDYLNAGTGYFTELSAADFVFPANIIAENLYVTDTLTGSFIYGLTKIYCPVITGTLAFFNGITVSGGITGNSAYFNRVTGSSAYFSTFTGSSAYFSNISGSSAYFTSITSLNISDSLASISQLTGTSAYFTSITGINISTSQLTGTSAYFTSMTGIDVSISQLTGTSAYFTNITGTSAYLTNITGTSAYLTNITGTSAYLTNITGTSAYFTSMTGIDISISQLTGTSAYFTSMTGIDVSISQLTGTSAYFTNITSPSGYFSNISLIENAISPVAPFPRQLALYSKSNDNLYIMNSLGTETLISLSATGMEPNQVFATPDGVFGFMSTRSLVPDDIPTLPSSKINGLTTALQNYTYSLNTGILSFGELSIDAMTGTMLDVSAGTSLFIDNADPETPVIDVLFWPTQVVSPPNLGINGRLWVGIQRSSPGVGTITFSQQFSAIQLRTIAVLGRIWSNDGTNTITNFGQYSTPGWGAEKTLEDLCYAIGSVNITGNVFTASTGGTLYINKTNGKAFRFSAGAGLISLDSPNIISDGSLFPVVTYEYHVGQQNDGISVNLTAVDPNNYDNAGILTPVPLNQFTNQRLYYYPGSEVCSFTYGQHLYNNLNTAVGSVSTEIYVLSSGQSLALSGAILRGAITIQQGTTDISQTSQAVITLFSNLVNAGATSGGGGVSPVSSVNGQVGAVNITPDDLNDSTTVHKFVTANDLVNLSNLSGINTGDVTIGIANGLSLSGQQLSLQLATSTQTGALSPTDWVIFYNKQSALGFTPENVANKSTDITLGGGSPSTTLYPTQSAVAGYISTSVSTNNITGGSAFFITITGTNIFGKSVSLISTTGSTSFIATSITTNGLLTSGGLSTYNIFAETGSVSINNLSGDSMTIGVNTWNITGFNTSWTTTTAGMGGGLVATDYMFHVSDDMQKIGSYNTNHNSVWNGTHYISVNGGSTWYPCIGNGYDINGGITVSRDGSFWIGTRTSTGADGGIYRSTDSVNFTQVLSVPVTGGITFVCCEISSNDQAILVCTDSPNSPTNYQVPFYISLDGGNTWKSVIPSSTYDHYWISDTALSYDGKYMLVLDRNGVFVSNDYGNTWNLTGPYLGGWNRQIAMSQDGTHMYLCSVSPDILYQYSLDFGQTWITNSPNPTYGYSGVDCDETGRYVYLTGDLTNPGPWFWFSSNYGQNFTMFTVLGMTGGQITVDVNVSSDGSNVMIYDGVSELWFKTMTDRSSNTGNLIVNGNITFTNLTGSSGFFTTIYSSNSVTGNSGFFSSITGTNVIVSPSFTGGSAFFTTITGTNIYSSNSFSAPSVTGNSGFFSSITGTNVIVSPSFTGGSAFFTTITGTNIYSSNSFSAPSVTGNSGFFSSITGTNVIVSPSFTGGSAFFTTITGTNIYSSNSFSAPSVTGNSGFFSSITGTNVIVSPSFTGGSAFFTTITGTNIYSSNSFSAPSVTGNSGFFSSITGTNVIVSPSFTGGSAFFTTITGTNIYSSNSFSAPSVTGNSGFFSSITGTNVIVSPSFTGGSAFFTTITGTNIYSSNSFSAPSVTGNSGFFSSITGTNVIVSPSFTGGSAFFTTITGTNIYSSNSFSAPSVTGNSGFFSSITGTNVIVSPSFTGGSAFFTTITGTNIYSSNSFSAPSVTGNSGFFSSITGTNVIVSPSFTGVSAYFTAITGTSLIGGASHTGTSAFFTTITGTNFIGGSSHTGYSGFFNVLTGVSVYFSSITGTNGSFSNLVVPNISGFAGYFNAITGISAYMTSITGTTTAYLSNLYVSGNIIPNASGGVMYEPGTWGWMKFINVASPDSYYWKISASDNMGGNSLLSIYNNPTGSPSVTVPGTASSTSTTTGALTVAGGVGIGGVCYVGNVNVTSTATVPNISGFAGYFNAITGISAYMTSITGTTLNLSGNITVSGSGSSTSSTTGALVVAGGVGIGGNLNVAGTGGTINSNNIYTEAGTCADTAYNIEPHWQLGVGSGYTNQRWTVGLRAPDNGTLGGCDFSVMALYDNGNAYRTTPDLRIYRQDGSVGLNSATASTNATTGALVVAGGVGIGGNVCVGSGGNVYVANTVYADGVTVGDSASTNTTLNVYGKNSNWNLFVRGSASTSPSANNYLGIYETNSGNTLAYFYQTGQVLIPTVITSTSTSTGSLVVFGGVGIGGALYQGGGIYPTSSAGVYFEPTYNNIHFGSGALTSNYWNINTTDGSQLLHIYNNSSGSQCVIIDPAVASTSPSTGSLVVNGGAGIGGDCYIGGTIHKGGGTFEIPHPDPEKIGWKLRHCFVESNTRGTNLYEYEIMTTNLTYTIPLPSYFKYINERPYVYISAKNVLGYGFGNVDETMENATINVNVDGTYYVMISGVRKDKLMRDLWDQYKEEVPPTL